jgi:spore photoproduct lyase
LYKPYYPDEIWIEEQVFSQVISSEIVHRLKGIPVKKIDDIGTLIAQKNINFTNKILVLAEQKGKFLKPCPGTQNYICCGYYFLNLTTNCEIDCSYCILQGYLNNPFMTVYTNIDDLFKEVDQLLNANSKKFFRIGTGELTDSLTLDHITHYSKRLIPFFLGYKNAILELKTKTTQIDHVLNFFPENRVIVSWSLNPSEIIKLEEKNAPSLKQRLTAAQQCARAGYLVGFHLDPLIHYAEWEQGYLAVVKELFQKIPATQIVWISLGALRFPPVMLQTIRKNHPQSHIILGEMFPGKDGKMRYFRPIREKMFKKIVHWIREESEDVKVYLCMESPEVWEKIEGIEPLSRCGLSKQLDQAVIGLRNG